MRREERAAVMSVCGIKREGGGENSCCFFLFFPLWILCVVLKRGRVACCVCCTVGLVFISRIEIVLTGWSMTLRTISME